MCPPRKRRVAVMVWGWITYDSVGTLCLVDGNITALKYIDILDEHLWPVIARHFSDKPYLFQDDNAPVHRARITREFKVYNNIPSITWPAQSPDINIIENIWLKIKRSLPRMNFLMLYLTFGKTSPLNTLKTCTYQFPVGSKLL